MLHAHRLLISQTSQSHQAAQEKRRRILHCHTCITPGAAHTSLEGSRVLRWSEGVKVIIPPEPGSARSRRLLRLECCERSGRSCAARARLLFMSVVCCERAPPDEPPVALPPCVCSTADSHDAAVQRPAFGVGSSELHAANCTMHVRSGPGRHAWC